MGVPGQSNHSPTKAQSGMMSTTIGTHLVLLIFGWISGSNARLLQWPDEGDISLKAFGCHRGPDTGSVKFEWHTDASDSFTYRKAELTRTGQTQPSAVEFEDKKSGIKFARQFADLSCNATYHLKLTVRSYFHPTDLVVHRQIRVPGKQRLLIVQLVWLL